MEKYAFFPSQKSLKQGIAFGVGYLVLARIYGLLAGLSVAEAPLLGKLLIALFVLVGVHALWRGISGLVRPKPCCIVDANGISVKGGKTWGWGDLVEVRVRRLWMGPVPLGTWVSVRVKKNGRGLAKRVEIPWTLLPGPADETAAAILQAALMAGWQPKSKRGQRKAAKLKTGLAAP